MKEFIICVKFSDGSELEIEIEAETLEEALNNSMPTSIEVLKEIDL